MRSTQGQDVAHDQRHAFTVAQSAIAPTTPFHSCHGGQTTLREARQ